MVNAPTSRGRLDALAVTFKTQTQAADSIKFGCEFNRKAIRFISHEKFARFIL